MIGFTRPKLIFFMGALFLSGCVGVGPAANYPRPWPENQIISKTHTEKFFLEASSQNLVSKSGKDIDEFLRDAKNLLPGRVVATVKDFRAEAARIWTAISASGIQQGSRVEVRQAVSTNEKTPDLTFELTYFAYKLADCGAITNPRKIDSTNLMSPGFGCSVERNRMLSLSYPPDWLQGRPSSPTLAVQDGQAVQFLYEKAPRVFPSVNE